MGRLGAAPSGPELPAELLKQDAVARHCRWLGLDEELTRVFLRAALAITQDENLLRIFQHVHWVLSQPPGGVPQRRNWPMMPDHCGEAGRMLYALVCLCGIEQTRVRNARRGIDEDITRRTLSDLALWVHQYHQETGQWGFSQMFWLTGHMLGELHHLGRLQFQIGSFPHDFHMLRSFDDDRHILLAGNGMQFRADGQFANADTMDDPSPWTATYRPTATATIGQAITERGAAMPQHVSLDAVTWTPCLEKTDPILEVHIPAGGPMDHHACSESFQWALLFFPAHFPEHHFKAFTCESWLMDSQLEEHLPAQSNIVHFLRRFHRHPVPKASDHQILERVFGSPQTDLRTAPRDTTLRRIVIAHVESGGRWHGAGGIIPR